MDIIRIPAPSMPEALKHAHPPPAELFVRGCLPSDLGVAVVGTRRVGPYGRACVARLVPAIVRAGLPVISGLAFGVDAEAHQATLDRGGVTVAVLGSGADDEAIYPRDHTGLARRILESGGALVSEYPPGTRPRQGHFPARNRIIAALSRAVLVIEAPMKSGAMITARLALEHGVDVWAVPGPIVSERSEGPNRLIRQGATPITCAEDIYDALGLTPLPESDPVGPDPMDLEARAIEALRRAALTADELARATDVAAAVATALLTILELRGLIRSVGGGRYTLYT